MAHVFLTGVASGIGRALAELYLKQNQRVTGIDRKTPDVRIGKFILCDLRSEESILKAVAELEGTVDVLIHCAAIYPDVDLGLCQSSIQQVQDSFGTNALGPLMLTRTLIDKGKIASEASVAILSSDMSSISKNTSGGSYGYRIAKAALNMFAKNLSIEFPKFNVHCLHPGHVKTPMGGPTAPILPADSAVYIAETIRKPAVSPLVLESKDGKLEW